MPTDSRSAKSAVIRLHDFTGARWFVRSLGRSGSITVTSRAERARRFTEATARTEAIDVRQRFGSLYNVVSVEAAA